MPDICPGGQFRTKAGRCMNTNPWVQWIKFQGKQGNPWPPSASYHAIPNKAGLRRSDIAMTDHNRDGGRDMCLAMGSAQVSTNLGAAYTNRDGLIQPDQQVRLTAHQYPTQKHLKVRAVAMHEFGWQSGNPDGALVANYRGQSFTLPILHRLVVIIDNVYFDGTLLTACDATSTNGPLRIRFPSVAEEAQHPNAYMYHRPNMHDITVVRSVMYGRPVLPVRYECVRHDTWLDWTIGVLCHEMTHMICHRTCPNPQPCKHRSTIHGNQFNRLMKNMFARGPAVATPAIPQNGILLAMDVGIAVIATKSPTRKSKRGSKNKRGDYRGSQKCFPVPPDVVKKYRKNGFNVFTIVFDTVGCVVMSDGVKRRHNTSPKTSPKKSKTKSRLK